MQGTVPKRMGSTHPNIAPYGDMLTCHDGDVVLAVGSDAQFTSLCKVLGCEALADDPRFHINAERVKHREDLVAELNAKAFQASRADVLAAFLEHRVPAGAVHSVQGPGQRDGPSVLDRIG